MSNSPLYPAASPSTRQKQQASSSVVAAVGIVNTNLVADGGSYAITGASTTALLVKRKLDATTPAVYAIAGSDVALNKGKKLVLDGGSYAVTGTTATLRRNLPLIVETAAYAITGTAATLRRNLPLSAAAGSYAITGTDAALTKLANKTLAAAAGSYAITGAGDYVASAVHFDGSTYLSNASLTASDGYTYSYSAWVNVNSLATFYRLTSNDPDGAYTGGARLDNGTPGIELYGSGDGMSADANDFIPSDTWCHVLISVDTHHPAVAKIYVNDVDVTDSSIDDNVGAFVIALNGLPMLVNADTGFTAKYVGDMADLWVSTEGLLVAGDIPEVNRRKFISASGKPVDPVNFPTGFCLFSGDATGFATNQGTGGAFTLTGSLTDASSSPSAPHVDAGPAVSLLLKRKLTTEAASYAIAGTAATLTKLTNKTLPAETASYAISGTNAALTKLGQYALIAEAGAYAISGSSTSLLHKWILTASPAAGASVDPWGGSWGTSWGTSWTTSAAGYAITGTAATLTVGEAAAAFTLSADSGSYAIAGASTTSLLHGWKIAALPASYAITGTSTTALLLKRKLAAETAAYAITGTPATLRRNLSLSATVGSIAITGSSTTNLLHRWKIAADAAAYTISGTNAALTKTGQYALIAEPAGYAISGTDATLTKTAGAGAVAVWNGSAWVQRPAKVWNGSAWVQKPVKHWTGSAWAA